ncbi:tRNA methyltransferase 10 [Quaeritorhiza haematococci]|nr:tRNA methyltransferase 10 [Quaeritorhiza haematococci]
MQQLLESSSPTPAVSEESPPAPSQSQTNLPPHPAPQAGSEMNSTDTTSEPAPLSKRAQKRALKERAWEKKKAELKQLRREKRKAKRKEQSETIKSLKEEGKEIPEAMLKKKRRKIEQVQSQMHILLDTSFDDLMTPKELFSMGKQISQCYAANRASPNPAHLKVTGLGPQLKDIMNTSFPDWPRWKMSFEEKLYTELYEGDARSSLVYLTADSPNVLEELDESKVYIIGGIVDRNRHKNLCFDRAKSDGIATAQLPISQHINMKTRRVLTVNHVFEILLKYLETRDWKTTLSEVIPARKGVDVSEQGDEDEEAGTGEGAQEKDGDVAEKERKGDADADAGEGEGEGEGVEEQGPE